MSGCAAESKWAVREDSRIKRHECDRITPMEDLRLIGYWRSEKHPEYPDPHDLVDETWNADERHQLWFYLATGTMLRPQMGKSNCRICGAQNGAVEYTDGTYIWPEGLGHYIYDHAVRLPADVILHATTRLAELEARAVSVDWWLTHHG